jgi:hypothetical protein
MSYQLRQCPERLKKHQTVLAKYKIDLDLINISSSVSLSFLSLTFYEKGVLLLFAAGAIKPGGGVGVWGRGDFGVLCWKF